LTLGSAILPILWVWRKKLVMPVLERLNRAAE
jgi:hypothetical protein